MQWKSVRKVTEVFRKVRKIGEASAISLAVEIIEKVMEAFRKVRKIGEASAF